MARRVAHPDEPELSVTRRLVLLSFSLTPAPLHFRAATVTYRSAEAQGLPEASAASTQRVPTATTMATTRVATAQTHSSPGRSTTLKPCCCRCCCTALTQRHVRTFKTKRKELLQQRRHPESEARQPPSTILGVRKEVRPYSGEYEALSSHFLRV